MDFLIQERERGREGEGERERDPTTEQSAFLD
jgi:hypothetical protein